MLFYVGLHWVRGYCVLYVPFLGGPSRGKGDRMRTKWNGSGMQAAQEMKMENSALRIMSVTFLLQDACYIGADTISKDRMGPAV